MYWLHLCVAIGYAGGSYGGYGGMSSGTNPGEPYGSLFMPTSLGSGGGQGAGGGHLTLEVCFTQNVAYTVLGPSQ